MEALKTDTLPDTSNDALITLIFKKDRDTLDPSNFRPISLYRLGFKILTKSNLEEVSPVINGDQGGFIKNRSSADNM